GGHPPDGPGSPDPGPALVTRAADRRRQEVRVEVDASGARRQATGRAARATAGLHSPDPPGSDRGDRPGPGRLALARPREAEGRRAVGSRAARLLLKYASGTPRTVSRSAAKGRQAVGSPEAGVEGTSAVVAADGGGPAGGTGGAFEPGSAASAARGLGEAA